MRGVFGEDGVEHTEEVGVFGEGGRGWGKGVRAAESEVASCSGGRGGEEGKEGGLGSARVGVDVLWEGKAVLAVDLLGKSRGQLGEEGVRCVGCLGGLRRHGVAMVTSSWGTLGGAAAARVWSSTCLSC